MSWPLVIQTCMFLTFMDVVCGGRDGDECVLLWAVTGTSQAHGRRGGTGERREPVAGLLVPESDPESAFLAHAPGDSDITGPEITRNVSDWRVARHCSLSPERPHTPGQSPTRALPGPALGVPLFCPTCQGRILLDPQNSATCHLWKLLRPGPCASPRYLCEPTVRHAGQEVDTLISSSPSQGRALTLAEHRHRSPHTSRLAFSVPSFRNESGFNTGERL